MTDFRPDRPKDRDWIPAVIWTALLAIILIAAYFVIVVHR